MADARYDDRLDVATELGLRDVVGLFRRSLAFLWPHRRLFGLRIGLIVLILIAGLPLPWLLKILVDHGVLAAPITDDLLYPFFMYPVLEYLAPLSPLVITLHACVGLAVLFLFFGYAGNTELEAKLAEGADVATRSENKASEGLSSAHGLIGVVDLAVHILLSQRVSHAVRVALFERFNHLQMTSVAEQRSGDAIFRVMHDTPSVAGICLGLTMQPFFMIASVAVGLWILTIVYGNAAPALVWIGFSAVFFTLFVTMPFSGWARRVSQRSRASGSATTNSAEEGLRRTAAIQSLGGNQNEREAFDGASQESFRQSLVLIWVGRIIEWVGEHVHLVYQTAGFWVIFDGIIQGSLTLGDIAVVLRMYSLLYETSMAFGRIWIDQQDNAAAARRVFFVEDHVREAHLEGVDDNLPPATFATPSSIVFEDVAFAYPSGPEILHGIDLTIDPGITVAVVGPTGAGKTTLAYLVPKFLAPTRGRVLVDGSDLATVETHSVRQQVSFVFQEHQLLTGTVRDNLAMAAPEASDTEMEEALRGAGAWDFVASLHGGLDAFVGEGGSGLSIGQRQRLSIARGLLRRGPVLILDEPTAALDAQTEQSVIAALTDANRTSIVIAHRLSTIRHADRIVFLEAGRIVEQGTHEELMGVDGRYRSFVAAQRSETAG